MAAAQVIPIDEDSTSPAELVAQFSGADLLAASQDTSPQYRGMVIAKAVVIVQTRLRCRNIYTLAKRMGISKSIMFRWATAKPVSSHHRFSRALRELAFQLADSSPVLTGAKEERVD
jgi:hypothetical protein